MFVGEDKESTSWGTQWTSVHLCVYLET